MAATINVEFDNGTGGIIATLHSFGKQDVTKTIDESGSLDFPTANSGDTFSTTLACNGTATLTITASTHPTTPISYNAGKHGDIFLIV